MCVEAGDIKVERLEGLGVGFPGGSVGLSSVLHAHTLCVWYDILNGTGMSQSVFACLDLCMCM